VKRAAAPARRPSGRTGDRGQGGGVQSTSARRLSLGKRGHASPPVEAEVRHGPVLGLSPGRSRVDTARGRSLCRVVLCLSISRSQLPLSGSWASSPPHRMWGAQAFAVTLPALGNVARSSLREVERVLGWSAEEHMSVPHWEYLHPDDQAAMVESTSANSFMAPARATTMTCGCCVGTRLKGREKTAAQQ
jgi:hypothetical protein